LVTIPMILSLKLKTKINNLKLKNYGNYRRGIVE
jgi:hypothetical protein